MHIPEGVVNLSEVVPPILKGVTHPKWRWSTCYELHAPSTAKKKKKKKKISLKEGQGFTLSEGVSQSWRNSLREGQGLTLSEGVSQSWKEYVTLSEGVKILGKGRCKKKTIFPREPQKQTKNKNKNKNKRGKCMFLGCYPFSPLILNTCGRNDCKRQLRSMSRHFFPLGMPGCSCTKDYSFLCPTPDVLKLSRRRDKCSGA